MAGNIIKDEDRKGTNIQLKVKWAPDNLDGYLNFYSVSGDGRVSNWTIVKTALWTNDTLLINFCKTLSNLGEESVTDLLMGIVTIDLNNLEYCRVKLKGR